MNFRQAIAADLPSILEIHNDAVRNLSAIWTTKLDTLEDRLAWLEERTVKGFPILIADDDEGNILGFGSYGTFRGKSGYDLTVEHSVYLKETAQGKGIGRALMQQLIQHAQSAGFHVMIGAIESGNTHSIALHEKLGFEIVGTLPEVGHKYGRWLSLCLMTLKLSDAKAPPHP
ncbi:GNAT family N-acetyltransferase [Polycladidibacter hongkongensis]|uniref:GNAT family N-acetyltransferase n=1 Tax=Polycladidibacter hongkongensis TaxID=1647556 RepID=UPI0008358DD1|nr:GNAT family N-acetyltransferase [Pseudovibrio hongkongensis]